MLTERLVFRGAKPGTVRSRAIRFFLLNNLALLVRLPLLHWRSSGSVSRWCRPTWRRWSLLFLVRFVVADRDLPAAGASSRSTGGGVSVRGRCCVDPGLRQPPAGPSQAQRYLPYRYAIPGVATIGSQVRLRELEYFRAQWVGHDIDIPVRVGDVARAPRTRATMTQFAAAELRYAEHSGGSARTSSRLGDPIDVTVGPLLARSPHVVYTNIIEALLRFVVVSRGCMLLHSACLELDGVRHPALGAHRHRQDRHGAAHGARAGRAVPVRRHDDPRHRRRGDAASRSR